MKWLWLYPIVGLNIWLLYDHVNRERYRTMPFVPVAWLAMAVTFAVAWPFVGCYITWKEIHADARKNRQNGL